MSGSMTVAIISDVHGNDVALRAVLADMATQPYDALVIAGDHVFNGPHPAQALARLRALGAPMLLGNTDRYLLQSDPRPGVDTASAWTASLIGPDGVAALGAMPFDHRITPPGGCSPDDDLLIVHATPADLDAELILEPDPFGMHSLTLTPEHRAVALLAGERANLILYGHLHYASSGTVRGQRLTSIGAAGWSLDGDPQAAWALARWDGRTWSVEHRRVAYDVDGVAADLERVHPVPAVSRVLADRLRQARWLPFD